MQIHQNDRCYNNLFLPRNLT